MRGYPPEDLIPVVWYYFDEKKTNKRANDQAKLLIGHEKQTKKHFAEASDGEIKKPVDNSVPRNTKKSTGYAGTI